MNTSILCLGQGGILAHCKLIDVGSLINLQATLSPGRVDTNHFLRYLMYLFDMVGMVIAWPYIATTNYHTPMNKIKFLTRKKLPLKLRSIPHKFKGTLANWQFYTSNSGEQCCWLITYRTESCSKIDLLFEQTCLKFN